MSRRLSVRLLFHRLVYCYLKIRHLILIRPSSWPARPYKKLGWDVTYHLAFCDLALHIPTSHNQVSPNLTFHNLVIGSHRASSKLTPKDLVFRKRALRNWGHDKLPRLKRSSRYLAFCNLVYLRPVTIQLTVGLQVLVPYRTSE
jgi:hypothetical protein